jgi:hypothetical protein
MAQSAKLNTVMCCNECVFDNVSQTRSLAKVYTSPAKEWRKTNFVMGGSAGKRRHNYGLSSLMRGGAGGREGE